MSLLFSKTGLALAAFLLLGGYLLWTEHQDHLASLGRYWPLLLVLLCPLMHVFMHRHGHGHGGHGGHDASEPTATGSAPRRADDERGETHDA